MRIPIEPQPNSVRFNQVVLNGHGGYTDEHGRPLLCAHEVGDRLWVREAFSWFEGDSPNDFETGDGWIYRASTPAEHDDGIRWRSPIHMPRAASRILLEITDVRVERLQDITGEDAIAEGVLEIDQKHSFAAWIGAMDMFAGLWQSIYGPESWSENPWVWVITFKKI